MLDIRPLPAALGAVVTGIAADSVPSLDDAAVGQLRQAWADFSVLIFPQAHLTPAAQVLLATKFGSRLAATTETGESYYDSWRTLADDGYPEILLMDTDLGHDSTATNLWHSDVTFVEHPPTASLFCIDIVPTQGGDTMWSSQYVAYDNLSAPVKRLAEDLSATHGRPHKTQVNEHPVVRVHELSGRKYLYVNRGWIWRIAGVTKSESRFLIDLLLDATERPENQIRWTWSAGDAVLWDNRCTMHYALNDYGQQRRRSRRVTIYDS